MSNKLYGLSSYKLYVLEVDEPVRLNMYSLTVYKLKGLAIHAMGY